MALDFAALRGRVFNTDLFYSELPEGAWDGIRHWVDTGCPLALRPEDLQRVQQHANPAFTLGPCTDHGGCIACRLHMEKLPHHDTGHESCERPCVVCGSVPCNEGGRR
jgi:hypothetical protein